MKNKLLLDSHVLLWILKEPHRLGREAREAIEQAFVVYVSAASVWELRLKEASGKLPNLPASLSSGMERSGFLPLPVTLAHAEAATNTRLPHKDPFDQLLLTQARLEGLVLLTADTQLVPLAGTLNARR